MVSHQMQSSSTFHNSSLVTNSTGNGGYGSSLLSFSQQISNQNNSNPLEIQNLSQKAASDNDPLSPVEGLLIDEDE